MKRYDKKYTGMKKVILLFVFSVMVTMAWAQEYQMYIKARLKYDNNNVRCDSWFTIKAHTITGETYEWYENIDLGDGDWGEYEHTFTFPASKRIDRLDIHAKRETSDCKTRDEGDNSMTVYSYWYPCYNTTRTGLFRGYSGQSTVEVTISPLSMARYKMPIFNITVNPYVLQAEAQVECISSVPNFRYGVWVVYENGDEEEIIRRNRSLSDGEQIRAQGALVRSRSLVDRFEVRVTYGIFGQVTTTKTYDINDDGSDINIDWRNDDDPPIPLMSPNSWVKIRFSQPKTPLVYSLGVDNILPSANRIRLTVSEPAYSTFQWQYSLDGGANYTNVPSSFGMASNITFSGQDLFGNDWSNQLFKNIMFKAIYTCATTRESKVITLVHLPSAPGIDRVDPEMESCFEYKDGKIKITFKRQLYENELLYVFINGISFPTDAADFDGLSTTLSGYGPGTYNISLITTFAGLGNGYSDGDDHRDTTVIEKRTAITGFGAVPAAVHCFSGQDGRLTVSATGGTGVYDAYLDKDNQEVQHITFTQTASNSFTDLAQGTYVIRLKDSKGCDPKEDNGQGQVRKPSYIITEPAEKVSLSKVWAQEPRGFGLTDGYLVARAASGTSPYTFIWTDDAGYGLTGDAPVVDGATMLDTLKRVGKGIYHVRAQDNNYALALPQNETNLRGCYDTITIELDQPPLLEVALAEKHYVTCFNYKDGKVVARGTGGRPHLDEPLPYDYTWYEVLEDGSNVLLTDTDSVAVNRHSSFYRVMITDRNGITAWSDPFDLVQPDTLAITFNTSTLLCNGDRNGTSQSTVTGGTPDYVYAWSNEATTPNISALEEGVYTLVVRDTRGCITLGETEVDVPDGLEETHELVFPTCEGYQDGSIAVGVTGGAPPYAYTMNGTASTAVVENLGAGIYHMRITDANGCFLLRDYTLQDPALFGIELGPDRVLCKDQALDLDVALEDASAQYTWTKDGAAYATTAAVQLRESGSYAVSITDSKGCGNHDAVRITRDETEISASIIVASRAPQAEKVRVANISFPFADRVEWILPDEANILEETPDYIDLSFPSKGEYDIGMTSYRGACEMTTYTQVRVVDKRELTDYVTPAEPYIQQFIVTPNPNDGRFAATVELREEGNFALLLHNAQGEVIERKDITGQSFARLEFDVTSSVSKGVYVLQLVTTQGYSTFKVIIQ
jgi:hypothetical protein